MCVVVRYRRILCGTSGHSLNGAPQVDGLLQRELRWKVRDAEASLTHTIVVRVLQRDGLILVVLIEREDASTIICAVGPTPDADEKPSGLRSLAVVEDDSWTLA